jgi:hypothetical protein
MTKPKKNNCLTFSWPLNILRHYFFTSLTSRRDVTSQKELLPSVTRCVIIRNLGFLGHSYCAPGLLVMSLRVPKLWVGLQLVRRVTRVLTSGRTRLSEQPGGRATRFKQINNKFA